MTDQNITVSAELSYNGKEGSLEFDERVHFRHGDPGYQKFHMSSEQAQELSRQLNLPEDTRTHNVSLNYEHLMIIKRFVRPWLDKNQKRIERRGKLEQDANKAFESAIELAEEEPRYPDIGGVEADNDLLREADDPLED